MINADMDDSRRRRVLQISGAALVSGLAGCSGVLGGDDEEDDIQDTDGDGVIDSEDYAPRDPDIQREEQVKGESSTPTEEPTETPTREPTEEPTETPTREPTEEPTETPQFDPFTTTVRATDVIFNQNDYGSYAATKPDPINLSQNGISPGTKITLRAIGEYQHHPSGDTKCQLVGVFSETNTVLDQNDRIPGAIDAGPDHVTFDQNDSLDIDIPEDFLISGSRTDPGECETRETSVIVPSDAAYLMIGVADQNLSDNEGQVRVEVRPGE